jgi:heat-inducible transcriptional repressor
MSDILNARARDLFRELVDAYLETGEPVGSRTLARLSSIGLSPASIRNVMADLETEGLLFAPHTSAGRLPTQKGLRLYVDGLMAIGNLQDDERARITAECQASGRNPSDILQRATGMLAGMASGVGLVIAPKTDRVLKQIQIIPLEPGQALVVLVNSDGVPENRLIRVDPTLPPDVWERANNYLRARLTGLTLNDARARR